MNRTSPLQSAFPSTPSSGRHTPSSRSSGQKLPDVAAQRSPVISAIPFSYVDAPTQRLYVSIFYVALTVWRLYDYLSLYSGSVDGFWLFTKWVGIDTAFLFVLSSLRIPRLHWSSTTFTVLFMFHGVLNWLLMFQIPVPIFTWLASLTRYVYDREIAISERRVKPASILQNSSLILGKQIVNILPEGSAILNPESKAFCTSSSKSSVTLPIQINHTVPIRIDILRVDLDTNDEETIILSAKEIKKMKRLADAQYNSRDSNSPQILLYTVRQLGLYRLRRVVDDSNIELQDR